MSLPLHDVRFALRSFARAPVFTASLLLTLGLALAAAVTTFGVLDAVLARPLPLEVPDDVYIGWTRDDARDFDHYPVPLRYVDALPDRLTRVEAIGAVPYFGTSRSLVTSAEAGDAIRVATVAGDFFGALGAAAAVGELPRALEPSRSERAPQVRSHAYWRRRYGGADVIGAGLEIEDRAYQIRAVAPPGLNYPEGVDAWIPIPAAMLETPGGSSPFLDLVVRLPAGGDAEVARLDLERHMRELLRDDGIDAAQQTMVIQPLADLLTRDARPWLRAVALLVGLLLVVATLNATVLLLIRGLDRAREMAVRAAAGATRARLLGQTVTENLLLVAAAAGVAIAIAAWALDLLRTSAPPGLPRAESIGIDLRVAGFTAAAALVVSVAISGFVGAVAARLDPTLLLRGGARTIGATGARLRDALVIGQVALTVVVLGAAGVLARSLYNLSALEPGFDAESLVLVEVALPSRDYAGVDLQRRAFRQLVPAVEGLAGVRTVTALQTAPFPGSGLFVMTASAEGQDATAAGANPWINYEGVDDAYFETLAPRIVRGRAIQEGDRAGAPLVVVINRTLARLFWPGEDAIGKRLKGGAPDAPGEWRTVVGVVEDTRYRTFEQILPTLYFPYDQGLPVAPRYLGIRTAAAGPALDDLRRTIREAAPGAVVLGAPSITTLLEAPLARPRFHVMLLGCFAAAALLLSAVGVYGGIGTTVRQRRGELAVRLALGAEPARLRTVVLRRAARLAGVGSAIGVLAAVIALRAIGSLLYGVAPADPAVLAAVAALMLSTALAAAWLPARVATATDPNVVLRGE